MQCFSCHVDEGINKHILDGVDDPIMLCDMCKKLAVEHEQGRSKAHMDSGNCFRCWKNGVMVMEFSEVEFRCWFCQVCHDQYIEKLDGKAKISYYMESEESEGYESQEIPETTDEEE